MSSLRSTNGEPVDIAPMLAVSVSNVICNIMMSVRFSMNDPRFKHFTDLIEEGMRLFGELLTVDYIPTWQVLILNLKILLSIKKKKKNTNVYFFNK